MVQDVAHARAAGSAVKDGLEKKGWKIIGHEIYPTGTTDFSVGLSKAKDGKAQYFIPWFDMPEVSILMKQWYDMKVPALPIGYIHALQDEGTWKATDGKVANSVVLYAKAGSVTTRTIPMTEKFVPAHKKKYGVEPRSEWTSTSYMVAYILKDAIERAKSLEPDLIISALEKTDLMGTYGRIKFDPKNHQIIENGDPKETAVGMSAGIFALQCRHEIPNNVFCLSNNPEVGVGIDVRAGRNIGASNRYGLVPNFAHFDQLERVELLGQHASSHHDVGPCHVCFGQLFGVPVDQAKVPVSRKHRSNRDQSQRGCRIARAAQFAGCPVVPEGQRGETGID